MTMPAKVTGITDGHLFDMQPSTNSVLETDLLPSLKRPVLDNKGEAVAAALQSKRSLLDFQRNSIFREYDKARGLTGLTAGTPLYPALRSDTRARVSLAAAKQHQHEIAGVLCPVNGLPYVSLGQVATFEAKLPQLQSRQQTKSAVK